MGWFSCSAESAVATCDSQNWELLIARNKQDDVRRPFKITEFTFTDLTSATDAFSARNLLGKGSHGSVYRAQLGGGRHLVAAVKRTKHQPHLTETADNEVDILSRIYHPGLVNLIGFAVDPPTNRKLIVVEYMPNGSLYDLLHCSSVKSPGWVKRVRFALQIAKTLNFLHSSNPPVIHRDIKSPNVLIDSRYNSRISDFGLALRGNVEDVRMRSTPPAGTLGYLDPEYLAPGDISTKSDVFSFGILLLEIISGRKAIDLNYSPPSVVEWAVPLIKSGDIPWIYDPRLALLEEDEALQQMAVLAASCVGLKAGNRPAMAEVVATLSKLYQCLRKQSRLRRCVSFGKRVESVVNESRAIQFQYQALPLPVEDVVGKSGGGRRSGKVSSRTAARARCDSAGSSSTSIARSKSTGATGTISAPRSNHTAAGADQRWVAVGSREKNKMTRATLRKSRSTGVLRGKTLLVIVNHGGSGSGPENTPLTRGKNLKY